MNVVTAFSYIPWVIFSALDICCFKNIYVFGSVVDKQGVFIYTSAADVSMCIRNTSSHSESSPF